MHGKCAPEVFNFNGQPVLKALNFHIDFSCVVNGHDDLGPKIIVFDWIDWTHLSSIEFNVKIEGLKWENL